MRYFPVCRSNGLPGRRVDPKRAGMTMAVFTADLLVQSENRADGKLELEPNRLVGTRPSVIAQCRFGRANDRVRGPCPCPCLNARKSGRGRGTGKGTAALHRMLCLRGRILGRMASVSQRWLQPLLILGLGLLFF